MEKYTLGAEADADGLVLVRRLSDGLTAWCKPGWFKLVSGTTYKARSKTKAIRLEGLEWETEGVV